MRIFDCHCGATLFFDNVECLSCHRELGYLPDERTLSCLVRTEDPNVWHAAGSKTGDGLYRKCRNYEGEGVCNWMIAQGDAIPFCVACRLNDTIPSLVQPENRTYWVKLEAAKRRLVYTLLDLGLPVVSKGEDQARGLAFAFLSDPPPTASEPGAAKVLTGHYSGTITINVAEADDIEREQARRQMHESYRTLLGHFRHESGHYYWDRLVAGTPALDRYRALFGDETSDYGRALERHYAEGPAADWPLHFITAYASAHPWEDWAETWAHYLHMIDTLETSKSFGISSREAADHIIDRQLFPASDYGPQSRSSPASFGALVREWVWLSLAINAVNRSMGMRDAYPFVLSKPIAEKLQFVHELVQQNRVTPSRETPSR